MSVVVIDGYCHCGLSKYRPVEDVVSTMERHGVSRAVLVQHLGEFDNSYIEGIVRADSDRFAGVLLVDTDDPAADRVLTTWAEKGTFRGLRILAHTITSCPKVWESAAELGLNIVVFDTPTLAPYADLLADFASDHPMTRLVISHLGMPDIAEAPQFGSAERILSLADHPNIYLQLSGMHMFTASPYSDLVPLIGRLAAAFGPERLFYGSNFPVMGEEAVYVSEIDQLRTGKLGVHQAVVDQVLGTTALELWFS